jgi:aspartate aminotransferase-like enzyme
MPALLPDVDPEGLLEYSVVYTDRAVNHMSQSFQGVMRDISTTLKSVYNAAGVAVVPGSGTFGMEAVARQFANDAHTLIIRNGWFSFRWTQILEMGNIAASSTVLKARQISSDPQAPFAPVPLEDAVAAIQSEKPAVVFAPHVETSSGLILPDEYIRGLADAAHSVGGLLVLDCIASGTIWVDMQDTGVDVLISAPQKGWSASPCAGLVMLSEAGLEATKATTSSSFACDLGKWLTIMEAYEGGGHAYHATMPTVSRRSRSSSRSSVTESEACCPTEVSSASPPKASERQALLLATPTMRGSRMGQSSPLLGCRSPLAFRSNATSRKDSARSVSDCSDSTNFTTSTVL